MDQSYQQDLNKLCEGDTVGLRINKEGTLSFLFNGACKGVAMYGVYESSNMDVYAVVDHCGKAVSTKIVRASECKVADIYLWLQSEGDHVNTQKCGLSDLLKKINAGIMMEKGVKE